MTISSLGERLTLPGLCPVGGTTWASGHGDAGARQWHLTSASGATPAIIDGSGLTTTARVLDVDEIGNYRLTLIGITVTGGNTTGQATTTGGGISFAGTGTLTLTNSSVLNNISAGASGCGGGIYNNSAATVIITDSTIQGNSCPTAGGDGVVGSKASVAHSISPIAVYNNSAADNGGGALLNAGTATITNSPSQQYCRHQRGGIQGGGPATVTVAFSTFSNAANALGNNSGGAIQASAGPSQSRQYPC